MARTKQRETYGNGSVSPVMVPKVDKDGAHILGADGKPQKVQKRNKRGQLAWRICVVVGVEEYTDKQGRTRKRPAKAPQKVFYGTLEEARAFCKRYAAQYEHIDLSAAKMTFSKACAAWETSMRNAAAAAPNTIDGYMLNLGHMEKHIGNKSLIEITPQDIDKALSEIKSERNLTNTTMHYIHAVTKRVLEYAVDSEWIVRNPCAKVKAPKVDEVLNRRSLDDAECALFRARLDEAEAEAMREWHEKESRQMGWGNTFGRSRVCGLSNLSCIIALRIELATGLRRSEVCGLTWAAVDLERKQITVKQRVILEKSGKDETSGKSKYQVSKGKTKSHSSRRTIFIDADTAQRLAAWKAFQKSALHYVMPDGVALTQTETTPVCVGDNGSWLRPSTISRWWGTPSAKGFRDKIGFPGLCMHELRHTQATILLSNGVDIKTVQARMGHAKASHTLDLYAHALPAVDKAAADLMGAILNAPAQTSANITNIGKTA